MKIQIDKKSGRRRWKHKRDWRVHFDILGISFLINFFFYLIYLLYWF
jgi:hypothetical protein